MSELPLFGTNVDKSKVPPIHQKRIVNAFVNSFILKTATFLEQFASECEEKLLNFEVKLRQVDTQLKLVEAKLEGVSGETRSVSGNGSGDQKVENEVKKEEVVLVEEKSSVEPIENEKEEQVVPDSVTEEPTGVKAKDDYRYKKYFKMIHFGVPAPAIKMKLQAEGMDPDILDFPDKILPDGVIEPIAVDSDTSDSE